MRSSFWIMLCLFAGGTSSLTACLSSSDPPFFLGVPDASVVDAALPDGTSAPSANDAAPSLDAGLSDGPADNTQDFCKTTAAAGAAFCADFEQSTAVNDGWGDFTTSGGATLTLETSVAKQKKSALAKVVGTSSANGVAALSAVANARAAKSKMALEFDGYFAFPNGPPSTSTLFLTIALRTGTGPSGHYFIDIERGASGWLLLATGTSAQTFPGFGENAWHHFRLSYDATGAQGEIGLFIDNLSVTTMSRAKGPPPGGAPTTFDNVLIEHLGVEANMSTSFYIDNVVVTFP